MNDGIVRGVVARFTLGNTTCGSLQETTVLANDFVFCITCESAERGRTIDDSMIESAGVDDDEGAFEIDRAKDDFGVGPCCDTSQNAQKIETRSGVDR